MFQERGGCQLGMRLLQRKEQGSTCGASSAGGCRATVQVHLGDSVAAVRGPQDGAGRFRCGCVCGGRLFVPTASFPQHGHG